MQKKQNRLNTVRQLKMINKEINEQDFYFALKAWQDNVLIEKIDNASLDVILEKIIEEIKLKTLKDR